MSKLNTTEGKAMPKANGQKNEFIRVSKWIPSRQRGLRGFVYVQGNLDVVTNAMLAVGAQCEVRTRQGWVDGGVITQRAVFADAGTLQRLGIGYLWEEFRQKAQKSCEGIDNQDNTT